jgi:hypothetical protein
MSFTIGIDFPSSPPAIPETGRSVMKSEKNIMDSLHSKDFPSPLFKGIISQMVTWLMQRGERNEDAVDVAQFDLPENFEKPVCQVKGIYAVDGELRDWLQKELNVA